MIRLTRAVARRWLGALLHTHDTPRRTAAAFAVGILCGFSPFVGLHTVLGLIVAFALRLNRVAVIVGAYVNLPWLMVPYYTLTTMGAAWAFGVEMPPDFARKLAGALDLSFVEGAFWRSVWSLVSPLLWPYAAGSTFGALILAGISYNLAWPAIEAGRKHLHHRHDTQGDPR